MAPVSLRKLVKRFKDTEVLHGIDLEVGEGEFVVLVGPSGCGKSTTLRMIAGLEDISDGEIAIGDRVVNHVEPKDRNIAMVFQNYAIYPHMTVFRNIGFGLRTSKLSREEKEARIRETAELLDLTALLDRKPSQLSGGQRQRVAIGRAMVRDPAVFLFDEPLSNLDAQLRAQMRLEIKKLHQRLGSTIIFVTHDQVEAMTLADRIVIMRDGYIQQIGTPTEVYRAPANVFVAQFIGSPSMNLIPAQADGDGGATVDGIGAVPLPAGTRADRGKGILFGIRPDDLRVAGGNSEETVRFEGTVGVVEPLGHEMLVYLKAGENELIAKADGRIELRPGDAVSVSAPLGEIHAFDRETGLSLRSA